MKRMVVLQFALILIAAGTGAAQMNRAPKNQEAIENVALMFRDTWNRGDIKALAALLTEDVDFITVGGNWQKSRAEFETYHVRLHKIQMRDSVLAIKSTKTKHLKPDVAVAHVEWAIQGNRDPDGTLREPRQGIFTWVLEKRKGKWLIIASHNTNLKIPNP